MVIAGSVPAVSEVFDSYHTMRYHTVLETKTQSTIATVNCVFFKRDLLELLITSGSFPIKEVKE